MKLYAQTSAAPHTAMTRLQRLSDKSNQPQATSAILMEHADSALLRKD